ncbi:ABC transporter substrate-binding protein [Ilumatobacter nonamiensis]|uniref:ABC transporter substrate-binding protein n=1 Tax=Ilumatobacter nonamiensis TaxID=467093 RepID=UPI00058CDEBA|nr:ABC transporter substrate-binding protein [Ilumatobacter nonamiensis]
MDWKRLDSARRSTGPIEVDLIEAYAQGKIKRRDFVKRGAMIGLSVPFMGAIIAACGGSDDDSSGGESSEGSAAPGTDASSEGSAAPGGSGGEILAGIQTGDANSGLDPLNMLDLGTYCVCSQSFEYLVGLDADGAIGPTSLATEWSPNDDGSVWTFTLREGVTWQDGTPFTAADVAATMDRMVEVGAGIAGVVSEGAVETPDDLTAVVNLDGPNGNFPALVSIYNPQSLITPADYTNGTTLDERPSGTGAWIIDDFDPSSFRVRFTPNPNWWGGAVNLDAVTLQGFDSGGTQVAAMAAGETDAIQQFSVSDGANLLDDSEFTVLKPPSSNHRQMWFNTQVPEGNPFTDPRVRQAACYAVNRQQLVDTIYEGNATIANDHPVYQLWPYFDDTQEQRPYDPEMARQLLSDAGYADGISDTLQVGDLQEIPRIAAIIEQNLAEAGFTTPVGVTPNSDFYGEYWCTGASYGTQPESSGPGIPCGASATIGIVDYGHRPTPDIFFSRALQTDGDWNSSNYASSEFDQLFTDYQASVDVEGQKDACGKIQRLLHEDAPACYPFFFDYLSGHTNGVNGIEVTALGHMQFQKATKS